MHCCQFALPYQRKPCKKLPEATAGIWSHCSLLHSWWSCIASIATLPTVTLLSFLVSQMWTFWTYDNSQGGYYFDSPSSLQAVCFMPFSYAWCTLYQFVLLNSTGLCLSSHFSSAGASGGREGGQGGLAPLNKIWPPLARGLAHHNERFTIEEIIKIVATRCQILRLKCTKSFVGWGSAPDPAGGAYSAPQTPSCILGAYF